MAAITELQRSDAHRISELFGLGRVEEFVAIAAGTINSNFRLDSESGRYFVRVNEGKSLGAVRYEAAVLAYMRDGGIPTPAPLMREATQGLEPCALHGEKWISVFPWLAGTQVSSATATPAHCRAMGAAMAHMHELAPSAPSSLRRDGRYRYEDLRQRFEDLVATDVHETHAELRASLDLLADEFAVLDGEVRARQALPRGLAHADLFPDNLLFAVDAQTPRIEAILDFEQACDESLLYDLAIAINAWCFDRPEARGQGQGTPLMQDRLAAFVEGYRSVAPPIWGDADRLAIELRAAALRFLLTRITDVHLSGLANPEKDYRRFAARLRCWQAMPIAELAKRVS